MNLAVNTYSKACSYDYPAAIAATKINPSKWDDKTNTQIASPADGSF
jgi:hypothetical protein